MGRLQQPAENTHLRQGVHRSLRESEEGDEPTRRRAGQTRQGLHHELRLHAPGMRPNWRNPDQEERTTAHPRVRAPALHGAPAPNLREHQTLHTAREKCWWKSVLP